MGKCNAQTGIGDPYLPFREVLSGLLTGGQQDWTDAGRTSPEVDDTFLACFRGRCWRPGRTSRATS